MDDIRFQNFKEITDKTVWTFYFFGKNFIIYFNIWRVILSSSSRQSIGSILIFFIHSLFARSLYQSVKRLRSSLLPPRINFSLPLSRWEPAPARWNTGLFQHARVTQMAAHASPDTWPLLRKSHHLTMFSRRYGEEDHGHHVSVIHACLDLSAFLLLYNRPLTIFFLSQSLMSPLTDSTHPTYSPWRRCCADPPSRRPQLKSKYGNRAC
jgi:hypothetical protein